MGQKKNSWLTKTVAMAAAVTMIGTGVLQYHVPVKAQEPLTTAVSDNLTIDDYKDVFGDSTENLGKVWTDKSVSTDSITVDGQTLPKSEDADFQIAMSALSSAGNMVSTTQKPLDITMVFDVSGSMDEKYREAKTVYEEIYGADVEKNHKDYYIKKDNKYVGLSWNSIKKEYYHGSFFNRTYVTPKQDAEDTKGVQFYQKKDIPASKTTKLEELQKASIDFVNKIEELNQGVPVEKKHRVSLIKFAGGKSVTIGNHFYYKHGQKLNYTQIVRGLHNCEGSFKDNLIKNINELEAGGATSTDYAMDLVAAINGETRPNAKKVVIFFTDGEPTHGSKYDAAVARRSVEVAKGIKMTGADIYTVGMFDEADPDSVEDTANAFLNAVSSNYPDASDVDKLGRRAEGVEFYKKAEEDLSEIYTSVLRDIYAGSGYPTDAAPCYPGRSGYVTFTDELGDFMELADINGIVFNGQTYDVKNVGGQYVVENAKVETALGKSNLNKLKIQVVGTTIKINVPASLIPVYMYEIDSRNSESLTGKVEEATPIRVLYSVKLKDSVKEQLTEGEMSKKLAGYVEANKENGYVKFYANKYKEQGWDVRAQFDPAHNNPYYSFVEPTAVYTNEECSNPARIIEDKTYYVQQNIFRFNEDGTVSTILEAKPVDGKDLWGHVIAKADGTFVILRGTSVDRDEVKEKEVNKTETAYFTNRINEYQKDLYCKGVVDVLGNNGVLMFKVKPEPVVLDGQANLGITKVITGRDWTEGDEFTFKLELTEGNKDAVINGEQQLTIFTNDYEVAHFQDVTFTEAGTYKFAVSEVDESKNGLTYDKDVKTVVVVVTEKDGVLTAVVADESDELLFDNVYSAEKTEAQIEADKVLVGRAAVEGEFTFEVLDKKGEVVSTGTNAAAAANKKGEVTFTPIEYTTEKINADVEAGIAYKLPNKFTGKTEYFYRYFVREIDEDAPGITYSKVVWGVLVRVVDDKNGVLKAQIIDSDDVTPLETTFYNFYHADSIDYPINGLKVLEVPEGADMSLVDIEGKYEFTIKPVSSSQPGVKVPMPKTKTVKNDVAGNIDFGTVHFDKKMFRNVEPEEDNSRSITFTYEISEKGLVEGVTNDASKKTVSVTVTDDGLGNLTVESEDAPFVFTNTYTIEEKPSIPTDTESGIIIKKELTGRELRDNEFSFEMKDEAGAVVSTGKNTAAGEVEMSPVTFKAPGVYNYVLSEVQEDLPGITYDKSEYQVTAVVKDTKKGTLEVEWTVEGGKEVVFKNVYKALPASVIITGTKTLEGRDLTAGEFEFVLKDSEGKSLQNKFNNAEGEIRFDELKFDRAGVYEYTVEEIKGESKNITYDPTIYNVKIEVVDDGEGQLKANVIIDGNEIVFHNVYEKTPVTPIIPVNPDKPDVPGTTPDVPGTPDKPVTPLAPKTGDTANVGLWIGLVVAAAVIIGAVVVIRKKKNK